MTHDSQRAPNYAAASAAAGSDAWVEPTRALELRFGTYRYRYLASLVLILAGALLVQTVSVYSGYLLELGISAQVVGWLIAPSAGPRRAALVLPAAVCSCGLLIGSAGSFVLVVPLLAWLLVRQRPARSYLVVLLPLFSAAVLTALFSQYGNGVLVASIMLGVLVGSAWLARAMALNNA